MAAISDQLPPLYNCNKELEDIKVALDVALWVILYLGAQSYLSTPQMITAEAFILTGRLLCELNKDIKADSTAQKVSKYSSIIEAIVGGTLAACTGLGTLSTSWNIWGLFAAQLTLTAAYQVVMRKEEKEEYTREKKIEDFRCFIENVALWTIFAVGDFVGLSPLVVGIVSIGNMSLRLLAEVHLQKGDETTKKVARLVAYLEFIVGVTLMGLVIGNQLSLDNSLWLFFALQLTLLVTNQLAKRLYGSPLERYSLNETEQTPQSSCVPQTQTS